MNRTEMQQPYTRHDDRARTAKDIETMLGNSFATLVAIGAGVLAVLGLLVGFNVIGTDNPVDYGMLWLASAITTGLCANVFRREHHIIDPDEVRRPI